MKWKFGNNIITDRKAHELYGIYIMGGPGSGKTNLLVDTVNYVRNENDAIIHYCDIKNTSEELFRCKEGITISKGIDEVSKTLDELEKVNEARVATFKEYDVANIHDYNKKVNANDKMTSIILAIDDIQELETKPEIFAKARRFLTAGRAQGIYVIIATSVDFDDIRQFCVLTIALKDSRIAEKILKSKLYNSDLNILHEPGDFIGEFTYYNKDTDELEAKVINTNIKYFKL